jgi:hypothetical protein
MCFETGCGNVFMNIALRNNRSHEWAAAAGE